MQYRGSADHVTPFPHQGCQWQAGRNRPKEADKERWVAFHFSPRVFSVLFSCCISLLLGFVFFDVVENQNNRL